MAQLRVRIELKRPRKGIELAKLIRLAEEAQKFLRMVAEDVGIKADEGMWVAQDFYNQGVGFDNEFQFADVDHTQVESYLHAVGTIRKRLRRISPYAILPRVNWCAASSRLAIGPVSIKL